MASDRRICVGMIAGTHGVRGLVRLRSFTEEPEAIMSYGDLTDETGKKKIAITVKSSAKDFLIASVDGVDNKEAAQELHGTKLYAAREKMPKTKKREYYESDLVGLTVQDKKGTELGTVMAVHDHGAGTFLEIGKSRKDSFMLPFNDTYVPNVDMDGGMVTIESPEGWLDPAKPRKKPDEKKASA